MFKKLKILYLKWTIVNLKSEIADYHAIAYGFNISIIMLRSHHYHKERIEPSESFEVFKRITSLKIWKLKRNIVELNNTK